jgi:hypothetical protein
MRRSSQNSARGEREIASVGEAVEQPAKIEERIEGRDRHLFGCTRAAARRDWFAVPVEKGTAVLRFPQSYGRRKLSAPTNQNK